ncbi:hypothetical protein ASE63_00220 [Bosea sp. Root381]|uniref:nitrilase-related carbon-nitrogen hydrolase n=1 Tax=Bosea sp. Root381 TaxID=1736524 RepID=UPI0006FB4B99|nr:nitrilase-related carbon-nitrogen hydrolase [Bosea sp. Root381]KRE17674.1 hypothetical protein ASE63_00220 [Bosea sp. Root381]
MIATSFRLALAQSNPVLGDVAGNAGLVREARRRAGQAGAELVMFPELFLSGHPPDDLALKSAFQDACRKACEELARETADGGPAVLLGLPWLEGGKLYNACALLDGGVIQSVRFKVALADDDLLDETRSFAAGPLPGPVPFRDRVRLGLPIGHDLGHEEVVECLAETGAEILLSPQGSPFRRGAGDERMNATVARVVESELPLVHLNQVGGRGELVFDGASFVLDDGRNLTHQLPAFRETLVMVDWVREAGRWSCRPGEIAAVETGDEADYAACVLGLRDHAAKSGRPGIVLGLSGSIDTALAAAMAVDALGPENVTCVLMPSRRTAPQILAAAQACARALGARCEILGIEGAVKAVEAALSGVVGTGGNVALESSLESHVCGTLLAALADSLGWVLAVPAGRSGMVCGDAAHPGEAAGGFNPLRDLYATELVRLAALRNRWKPADALGPDGIVIPDALLAGGQALPPHDVLDAILAAFDRGQRVSEIVAGGHDREAVVAVERALACPAYRRRRAAPGIRIAARKPNGERFDPIAPGFVDTGEAAYQPDPALVRGVGRGGGESFDF